MQSRRVADRAPALSVFASSLHNISLQKKCVKIVQNLCLNQTSVRLGSIGKSVTFGVGYAIIIALQGGILFANLHGMAYLTQSNIQLGTAAL